MKDLSWTERGNKKQIYHRVRVYLSKDEVKMTRRQAEDLGLSVPAYLRMLIREEGGLVGRGHGFKREDLP